MGTLSRTKREAREQEQGAIVVSNRSAELKLQSNGAPVRALPTVGVRARPVVRKDTPKVDRFSRNIIAIVQLANDELDKAYIPLFTLGEVIDASTFPRRRY